MTDFVLQNDNAYNPATVAPVNSRCVIVYIQSTKQVENEESHPDSGLDNIQDEENQRSESVEYEQ